MEPGTDKKSLLDPNWAQTYFPVGEPGDENYSYGWNLSESQINDEKIRMINHGGEDPGYCASNTRIPSLESELLITTNSDYCILKVDTYKQFTRMVLDYLSLRSKRK